MQSFQTVVEDVFIWAVEPKYSANLSPLTVLKKSFTNFSNLTDVTPGTQIITCCSLQNCLL